MLREGDRLPEVQLRTADGHPVHLSDLYRRLLVIQSLRYYG